MERAGRDAAGVPPACGGRSDEVGDPQLRGDPTRLRGRAALMNRAPAHDRLLTVPNVLSGSVWC